jgi:hypothetical protein
MNRKRCMWAERAYSDWDNGINFLDCNGGILVFIGMVLILSNHPLQLFSRYTLLSAFVLLSETILDAMIRNFLQHRSQRQMNVSSFPDVTVPQFFLQQERYWPEGWECMVGRRAPSYHVWKTVAVQAAIDVQSIVMQEHPSFLSLTLQDVQINLLLCLL